MDQSSDTGWKNNTPHPCMQQREFVSNKKSFNETHLWKIVIQITAGIIGIVGLAYMKFVLDSLMTLPSIICGILLVIGFYGLKDLIIRRFNL